MSFPNPSSPRLERLIRQLSDEGSLTHEDSAKLNELLRGDVDACERYLNHMAVDAQLTREARSLEQPSLPFPERKPLRKSFRPSPRWIVAAAAAIALGALAWFNAPPIQEPQPIATVLFSESAQWRGSVPEEGQSLQPGPLHLKSGLAVLRFNGGTELALRGPAKIELLSSGHASMPSGRAFVRATEGAQGFTLTTPSSELVELGTEFSVMVDPSGATRVHVIDGEVSGRSTQSIASQPVLLQSGDALSFEHTHNVPTEIPFDPTRLADIIRQAQPRERPDLMLAYEGFHYDVGRYQPEDITRGKGWAGPWRLRETAERPHSQPDETTDMHIVHGKLNVVWPVEGGRLGMLEMPPGKTYRIRPMKHGIDMGSNSVRYFSLMVHEPDHSDTNPRKSPRESVRLTFRSSANYLGDHLSFGITNRLHPQIQTQSGVGVVSAAKAPSKQTTLWIGKIVSRKHGEDEISFRIYGEDDPLDYAEPAAWHVLSRGVHQDTRLDLLVLTSEGKSSRVIDEFRLGPTWRSVVPIQVLLTAN